MSCFDCENCSKVAYPVTNYETEGDPPETEAVAGGYAWWPIGNCYPAEACLTVGGDETCIPVDACLQFLRPDLEGPEIQTYRIHVIKENGVRLVHRTQATQPPYQSSWFVPLPYSVLVPFLQGYEGFIRFEIYGDGHTPLVFYGSDLTGSNNNPLCLVAKVINAPFWYSDFNNEACYTVGWVPADTVLLN